MTDSSEFSDTDFCIVDCFQAMPMQYHPDPYHQQLKINQYESNLPSINEVFNESPSFYHAETVQNDLHSNVFPFDSWSDVLYQKDVSLVDEYPFPMRELESFVDVKPDDQLMSSTQQLVSEFDHFRESHIPLVYEQQSNGPISMFRLQNEVHRKYYQVQSISDSYHNTSTASTLEYQPAYTNSSSNFTESIPSSHAFSLNSQAELGEFFAGPQHYFSSTSSSGTPQTSRSPIGAGTPIQRSSRKQDSFRLTRNGKIVKKVTQNCHANSQCSNCLTTDTTLWRRNASGEIECNACNLYFRKNGTRRPAKLQKRGIMRRTRNPRQPYGGDDSATFLNIQISP